MTPGAPGSVHSRRKSRPPSAEVPRAGRFPRGGPPRWRTTTSRKSRWSRPPRYASWGLPLSPCSSALSPGGPRPAMVPRGPGCQGHVLESRAPRVSVPSERVGFSPQTLDSSRDEAVLS